MNMKTKEKLKHVGGKQAYHLDDAFDNLTETLTLADSDNCPNVEKLFDVSSLWHYLDWQKQKYLFKYMQIEILQKSNEKCWKHRGVLEFIQSLVKSMFWKSQVYSWGIGIDRWDAIFNSKLVF